MLCLVLCFSAWHSKAQTTDATGQLDPTQTYTTGNIVQPTVSGAGSTPWVNGVYQDQLTCMGWGDPGYCGPNPIVRPGENINFSFGSTYLYQQQAIASILPNSGTGLQVTGYNFGFTAKNGNGWDDGRTDSLIAVVRLWDTTGGRGLSNVLERKEYDLNYKFNWTTFNYSENFTSPHAASNIGQVQYGFIGRDNNGWAGFYGPEIHSVNFSLKYSVDVCSVDPRSSPTCPGYLDAIMKLVPATTTAEIAPSSPIIETITIEPTNQTLSSTAAVTSNDPAVSQGAPVATVSSNPGTSASTSTSTVAAATSNPSTQSERSTGTGPSLSAILNIVRSEQTRISGVESTAVQQANEAAASASAQAQQQAESVAGTAVTASQTQQSAQQNTFTAAITSTQGGVSAGIGPQTITQTAIGAFNNSRPVDSSIESSTTSISTQQTFTSIGSSATTISSNMNNNSVTETENRSSINFTLSPIKDYLDEKTNTTPDMQSNRQGPITARKSIPDNDAAGGITIAAIAKQPPGYELYQLGMKDSSFYAPKEIYKNQRIVDNQSVLRQLNTRSDRIHQQMINDQYKN